MKIAEMFRDCGCFPSQDEMLADEVRKARVSYPNALSDAHALAMSARSLAKNLTERTAERDARCEAMVRRKKNGR